MTPERKAELRAELAEWQGLGPCQECALDKYLAEALDALDAAERRIRDLKFAMGDEAGWFDRFTAERARAEAAEQRAAEGAGDTALLKRWGEFLTTPGPWKESEHEAWRQKRGMAEVAIEERALALARGGR